MIYFEILFCLLFQKSVLGSMEDEEGSVESDYKREDFDSETNGCNDESDMRNDLQSNEDVPNFGEADHESSLQKEVAQLKKITVLLTHQMELVMQALHVEPCACTVCQSRPTNGAPLIHHSVTPPMSALPISEYAQRVGGGKIGIDRRTVSEYAQQHGGLAAVRRFGVPAPVASYYQKKNSTAQLIGAPGTSYENTEKEIINKQEIMPTPLFSQVAAQTGSPGFLRGRGRGRPKLIGDELDADLVEFMVHLKQSDPSLHLSAGNALEIARNYIMERAPGLLEEHGGHVKLKLTWAMKLVSRIVERQREMELGLPPGTLQSMGKSQQLADMLTLSSIKAMCDQEGGDVQVSATPEIVSVRELDLSHLMEGGEEGETNTSHHIGPDGEIVLDDD